MIVVFEDSYSKYQLILRDSPHFDTNLRNLPSKNINGYGRQNFAYIVNGVPTNWTIEELEEFVQGAKSGAQYLYLTDIDLVHEDIYSKFGSNWIDFVNSL